MTSEILLLAGLEDMIGDGTPVSSVGSSFVNVGVKPWSLGLPSPGEIVFED